MLGELLECEQEHAKALVDDLRVFHPREIAAVLADHFGAASGSRQRSRVAWAAGELCGQDGLPLLTRCAQADDANVRRLAASAMGKVFAAARTHAARRREDLLKAQQALAALQQDPAPQVREYAERAISELLRRTAQ
jgi:HEAT repeat protein